MRIVVIGQSTFGAKVLEALLEKGEEIAAVYTPVERSRSPFDPLKEAALAKRIAVFQPLTYKDDHVFAAYEKLAPDLTILAFVPRLIPVRFLELPTAGAICYHPSLLPRHRGVNAVNWAVIKGDTSTGLTIFWPDAGMDAGPILLQKAVDIDPDDTAGSLYFDHLFPMGVEALIESVALIKSNKAPKIPQNEKEATYEPPCDDRVAGIDWRKPGREIHNLIRGCDPRPGAYAYWKGEKLRFYGARLQKETADEEAGKIVQIDSNGIQIAVNGGRLFVGKIRSQAAGKVRAAEYAAEHHVNCGDRFSEN
jgi:methionyl-tRNA formyltransferase